MHCKFFTVFRALAVDIFGRGHYSTFYPQDKLMVLNSYCNFYSCVRFPGGGEEEVEKDEKAYLPAKLAPTHLCQPLLGQNLVIYGHTYLHKVLH